MAIEDVIGIVEERINALAHYLNKHKKSQVKMQSQFNKLLDTYNRLIENQRGEEGSWSNGYEHLFGTDDWTDNDGEEEADGKKPKLFLPDEEE